MEVSIEPPKVKLSEDLRRARSNPRVPGPNAQSPIRPESHEAVPAVGLPASRQRRVGRDGSQVAGETIVGMVSIQATMQRERFLIRITILHLPTLCCSPSLDEPSVRLG